MANLERVKDDPNNGEKEKIVVVGTVEDLSGKAKAAESSGEKAKENAAGIGLSGAKAGENTPKPSVARAGENTLRVSGEKV